MNALTRNTMISTPIFLSTFYSVSILKMYCSKLRTINYALMATFAYMMNFDRYSVIDITYGSSNYYHYKSQTKIFDNTDSVRIKRRSF